MGPTAERPVAAGWASAGGPRVMDVQCLAGVPAQHAHVSGRPASRRARSSSGSAQPPVTVVRRQRAGRSPGTRNTCSSSSSRFSRFVAFAGEYPRALATSLALSPSSAELVDRWRQEVGWRQEWYTAAPVGRLNGSSGRAVRDRVLLPLGLDLTGCG